MRTRARYLAAGFLLLLVAIGCGTTAGQGIPAATQPSDSRAMLAIDRSTPATIGLEPFSAATPEATATPIPSATAEAAKPVPTATRTAPSGRPVAVIVENEVPARPQTGLAEADVIYEAVAEFNLTRFVAIYENHLPAMVGPIRSGRAYHVAVAAEYQAAMAYCLGVPTVAAVVAASEVVNLDGCAVSNPVGFWRDWDRRMPHNLFVNVPTLREVAGGSGTYGPFARRADWTEGQEGGSIRFVYPEDHPVEWRYDSARREYLRWQDGEAHVDASGQQIAAETVIVQWVRVRDSSYYGERGYHELTLTGHGEAVVYGAGTKQDAAWQRDSVADSTLFLDCAGKEIMMRPGKVFVQLLATGTVVE